MRIRRVVAVLAAFASIALLAPSVSANEVCYDLDVNVNGQQLADESGCVDLP